MLQNQGKGEKKKLAQSSHQKYPIFLEAFQKNFSNNIQLYKSMNSASQNHYITRNE